MDAARELIRLIDKYSPGDGIHATALAGAFCIKLSGISDKLPAVYHPSVCVVVQGQKNVLLEDEVFQYGVGQFIAASVDLPLVGQVLEASVEAPYLCVQIYLNPLMIGELLEGMEALAPDKDTHRGLFVGRVDDTLMEAVVRYVKLLEAPEDMAMMAPSVLREIHYRVLKSEHGRAIAQMAVAGSNTQKIAEVIRFMKTNLDKGHAVDELAERVHMSASSFHSHFKAVTAMSPLQYLKRLRLTEARHIMLSEGGDASRTAYRVGYESASQFSREYARMFGAPPVRDVKMMRASLMVAAIGA